jgi:ribosome-associated protein
LNSQHQAQQKNILIEELNALIIDSIQDIKGKNILKLDLRQLDDAPTSFFIICEGDSTTQVKAISENIHLRLKNEAGESPAHYEGLENSLWICMDYFDIVIHLFHKDTRNYYELEGLWSDAIFTEYEDL